MLFERKPFSDLLAAECDLTGTVANIKGGRWVFGSDFTGNAKRTASRSRYRTTGFVAEKQSVIIYG